MDKTIIPEFGKRINIVGQVYLYVMLEPHSKSEEKPVTVKVTHARKVTYLPTGENATFEAYRKICRAVGSKGAYSETRIKIEKFLGKVEKLSAEMVESGNFSFDSLRCAVYNRRSGEEKNLREYWLDIASGKEKCKTREVYITAMRSFYRFLGCKVTFTDTGNEDYTKTGDFTITGRKSDILPKEVTDTMISSWAKHLAGSGKSLATQSVYLRSLRAVLYKIRDTDGKALKTAPKVTVKAGGRRKEDYVKVADIIRIKDYQGEAKTAADLWIILYLCNGCNMKDLIQLRWGDCYFKNKELSFIRSKTEGKAPVTVYIPVTEYLRPYLEKYASEPEQGNPVFPQLLGNASTDIQLTNAAHRWNALVRDGMSKVCEGLGIRQEKQITASTARNSYITTLTWNCVPDSFIDSMVGHSDGNKVLRGYQGTISPKMRARYNNLLFTDPEGEE